MADLNIDELFREAETRQPTTEVPDTVPSETVGSPLPQIEMDPKKWTPKGVLLIAGGMILILISVWIIVALVKKGSNEHSHGTSESDASTDSA